MAVETWKQWLHQQHDDHPRPLHLQPASDTVSFPRPGMHYTKRKHATALYTVLQLARPLYELSLSTQAMEQSHKGRNK